MQSFILSFLQLNLTLSYCHLQHKRKINERQKFNIIILNLWLTVPKAAIPYQLGTKGCD